MAARALQLLLACLLTTQTLQQEQSVTKNRAKMRGGKVKGGVPPVTCSAEDGPHGAEPQWSYHTKNFIQGSAAVSSEDGAIYVGSNVGSLFALEPNGVLRWQFDTDSYVRTTPTIGPDGTIYFGSDDKRLYALNADGSEKWRFETKWIISSAPAIAPDGTVYVASMDRKLYALTPEGKKKWKYNLLGDVSPEGIITSSPVLGADGTVFIGSVDEQLYAITPKGKKLWSFKTDGEVRSTPAVSADGSLVFVGSVDGNLYAVSATDGELKWKLDFGGPIYGSVAVGIDGMTDMVYVGGSDGIVRGVDAETGEESWRYTTGEEINGGVTVDGGTLYIGSGDNKVYSLFTNGDLRWNFTTGSFVSGAPVSASNAITTTT